MDWEKVQHRSASIIKPQLTRFAGDAEVIVILNGKVCVHLVGMVDPRVCAATIGISKFQRLTAIKGETVGKKCLSAK